MGATLLTIEIQTTDSKQMYKRFEEVRDEDAYEYGHGGYSGSWVEVDGLTIVEDPYPEQEWTEEKKELVEDWLDEHCEKRGPALAIRTPTSFLIGGLSAV